MPKRHSAGAITRQHFLVHAIRELLDPNTLDTFRVPALNSNSRAAELADLISQPTIRRSRLRPFFSELRLSISEDVVLKSHGTSDLQSLLDRAQRSLTSSKPLGRTVAERLIRHLAVTISACYSASLRRLMRFAAKNGSVSDSFRYLLVRVFISHLQWTGFEERFIRNQTDTLLKETEAFLGATKKPTRGSALGTLSTYIDSFQSPTASWNVYFFASRNLASFHPTLSVFGLRSFETKLVERVAEEESTDEEKLDAEDGGVSPAEGSEIRCDGDLPTPVNDLLMGEKSQELLVRSPVLVLVRDIVATDPYRARAIAERRLNQYSGVCRFYRESVKFSWESIAIVENVDSGKSELNGRRRGAMDMRRQFRRTSSDTDLVEQTKNTRRIIGRDSIDVNSRSALTDILEFHRAATEIKKPEAQLLTLWAGIERFFSLSAPEAKDAAGIDQGIDRAARLLAFEYPEIVLDYVTNRTLSNPDAKKQCEGFIESLSFSDDSVKARFKKSTRQFVFALTVCGDLADSRSSLLDAMTLQPFLCFQIRLCNGIFGSATGTRRALARHRAKVRWNLNRIYAARNSVIHSAGTAHRIESLVEIARSYLVALLDTTMDVLGHRVDLGSFREAAHWIDSQCQGHRLLLRTAGACTLENYMDVLYPSPIRRDFPRSKRTSAPDLSTEDLRRFAL